MKLASAALALLIGLATSATASAQNVRDQIRIVGSSTVFPFATAVAEQFGKTTQFKTPVVESTGSGGGLKLFCSGVGMQHPDITKASRRIKVSEIETCDKSGVTDVVEIKVGFDGIVLANANATSRMELTLEQVFRALAKEVPIDGKLVKNPYNNWSDIDSSLPRELSGRFPCSRERRSYDHGRSEPCAHAVGHAGAELSDRRSHRSLSGGVRS